MGCEGHGSRGLCPAALAPRRLLVSGWREKMGYQIVRRACTSRTSERRPGWVAKAGGRGAITGSRSPLAEQICSDEMSRAERRLKHSQWNLRGDAIATRAAPRQREGL